MVISIEQPCKYAFTDFILSNLPLWPNTALRGSDMRKSNVKVVPATLTLSVRYEHSVNEYFIRVKQTPRRPKKVTVHAISLCLPLYNDVSTNLDSVDKEDVEIVVCALPVGRKHQQHHEEDIVVPEISKKPETLKIVKN